MPSSLRDPGHEAVRIAPDALGPRRTGPPMSQDASVARRKLQVLNDYGLHLRPAEKFVALANEYSADVRVVHEGRPHNGKSILDLMTLAAECGSWLELEAVGPDAEAALDALAALVASRFGEAGQAYQPGGAPRP